MNLIFGLSEQILLNKLFTFNLIKSKKLLFDKINFIIDSYEDELDSDEEELDNNLDKYDKIFSDILNLTNKNYCFDNREIDKLLVFDKILFESVELDFLPIEYYVEFILDLPENFLITYSNTPRTKNYTINILENDYKNESKKLINLIKKNIHDY